jgi:hypothetical protein
MTRFITFKSYTEYDQHRQVVYTATAQVNYWLEANPDIEIISWQATPVGSPSELCITVQYNEKDADERKDR